MNLKLKNLETMGNFRDLKVWIRSKNLAVNVYGITTDGIISKDFGLRDQIRRAAVSVPSNIAEGDALDTDKQGVKHFYIARGSLAELRTQFQIAYEIGYLTDDVFKALDQECDDIGSMITALIKYRSNSA
jgi:four helix bundle protein